MSLQGSSSLWAHTNGSPFRQRRTVSRKGTGLLDCRANHHKWIGIPERSAASDQFTTCYSYLKAIRQAVLLQQLQPSMRFAPDEQGSLQGCPFRIIQLERRSKTRLNLVVL